MTHLQFGTMRYLIGHSVDLDELREYNLTTLGSLLQRGWLERKGDNVTVTRKGLEAFDQYRYGAPNYRKHESELSDRVRLMLHMRSLNSVKNAKADSKAAPKADAQTAG